jgi:hypothetical protein
MNAPTIAEKRPVLGLVTKTNTGTRIMAYERKNTTCIFFPGIGEPYIFLFDFIQEHIPQVWVVI